MKSTLTSYTLLPLDSSTIYHGHEIDYGYDLKLMHLRVYMNSMLASFLRKFK
jgi:hypothetical protein